MPRQPRYVIPGVPQHVIQRGNNRGRIFFEDQDYRCFLKWLKAAAEKHRCQIHAYALMTNHVHLLVTPDIEYGLSKAMQSLGVRYVQYFNKKYERTGTLWEGKHKATLVESDRYLFACYRYIEMNPVRAGMVNHPGDYSWSSYRCHAVGTANPLITDHSLFLDLGDTEEVRQKRYLCMFEEDLNPKTLQSIRDATNKSWILGGESFKRRMEAVVKRRVEPAPRGGARHFKRINRDGPF